MEEALFKCNGSFFYVQYASDGDFDYTIYDTDFNIVDGGRLENDGMLDFCDVARMIIGESNIVKEVNVLEYADLI